MCKCLHVLQLDEIEVSAGKLREKGRESGLLFLHTWGTRRTRDIVRAVTSRLQFHKIKVFSRLSQFTCRMFGTSGYSNISRSIF